MCKVTRFLMFKVKFPGSAKIIGLDLEIAAWFEVLRRFFLITASSDSSPPDYQISLRISPVSSVSPLHRLVYQSEALTCFIRDSEEGVSVNVSLLKGDEVTLVNAFILAISCLGSYTDWYVVHGAAVDLDGKGVLILGGSGTGKTTLAALATKCGARIVSDDLLLINTSDGFLRCNALRRNMYVRDIKLCDVEGLGDGAQLTATDDGLKFEFERGRQPTHYVSTSEIASLILLGRERSSELFQTWELSVAEGVAGALASISSVTLTDPLEGSRKLATLIQAVTNVSLLGMQTGVGLSENIGGFCRLLKERLT